MTSNAVVTIWTEGESGEPVVVNQTLSAISQGLYTLTLPASCTLCTLLLIASSTQFTQGDIFYFGGLQLPVTGSPSASCNDSFTLNPSNYWVQSSTPNTGQSPLNCPSALTTFTVNITGASASLSFYGSGVRVFGKFTSTFYIVVCQCSSEFALVYRSYHRTTLQYLDGSSIFTLPRSNPPVNAPDTLFAVYNLDESQEHSLTVVNQEDPYSNSGELALYPFEIFGSFNE
jgi:hypothetical protein